MIGQTLGHYNIQRELGAGEWCGVLRHRQQTEPASRPSRCCRSVLPEIPNGWRASKREAQMLAALNHASMREYMAWRSQRVHYLVLEFVPGQTLANG